MYALRCRAKALVVGFPHWALLVGGLAHAPSGGLVLAVAFACAGAGVAVASPQFALTLAFTYSSKVPGSPSGFDSLATFSDPGEPGGKPKELTRIKVGFHPGTRIDTAALPRCRASDKDVRMLGLRACPASTRLGTVHAEGVISTGLASTRSATCSTPSERSSWWSRSTVATSPTFATT